jgi:WD40 repeat protein
VACTVVDGMPVAVTGGSLADTVQVWDLRRRKPLGQPMTGHKTVGVFAVACTVVDGVPVAVTVGSDDAVRVWNLRTRRPLAQPLTGHTGSVFEVACGTVDGVPVAVTGGRDGVRVWDLRSRTSIDVLLVPTPGALALTPAGDLVVGFGSDVAFFHRQPRLHG